jgi:hypothetical protein
MTGITIAILTITGIITATTIQITIIVLEAIDRTIIGRTLKADLLIITIRSAETVAEVRSVVAARLAEAVEAVVVAVSEVAGNFIRIKVFKLNSEL